MQTFKLGSISKKLAMLVLLSVAPAIAILFYSGIEQREQAIEQAKQKMLLITSSMADTQKDISNSVKQVLATLSLMPEIQSLDIHASSKIIKAILRQNPDYLNIALTDLNGDVLVSGKTIGGGNLADRKHFQEALERKDFAIGEFIISRVGTSKPAFAFAYPVLDQQSGAPIAVLTTIIKLDRFSSFHKIAPLPKNSFVAVTDHKGIRIFFYPSKKNTNPVGKPIKPTSWEKARKSDKPGIFVGKGSDGVSRMFAFQPIRFNQGEKPYLYAWAGIPEDHIFTPANTTLIRNLILMFLATVLALAIARIVGKKTLLAPIHELVSLTKKYADGDLDARCKYPDTLNDFGALKRAFHKMADALNQSHQTLRENEARFRLVMDSLDAFVYVADMDSHELLFINEYGKKLFGDATGSPCWQFLQVGQSGPCSFCTNKYLLDENGNIGDVHTWEFQNTLNGRWYYIQDRAITWLDGRIVRIEVATDITEKKQAEEEKIALEGQLRQAHKMEAIGTLAGGIAHDFNNILGIILGNAELANISIAGNHPARHNIDQVLSASNRAKDLVKRLLTFSRQEKGEKKPSYLYRLVDESLKTLRSTIPKSVKLEYKIPSRYRDNVDECSMINADPTQIHQLLLNLCVNAVHAMNEEGILKISVDQVSFKDDVPASRSGIKPVTYECLTVSDTGHGMDTVLVDKIFDPFFTTKDVDKGTGIGLSVVQGIVKNHEGYIFVESEPAKGTTFHIYFPVTDKKKAEIVLDNNGPLPRGNERILYIDDEEMLVEVGESMLEQLGYSVTTRTSSTEALELFQSDPNKFDLVITDQAMPNIPGSELAKQLLQIRPDIPIILCTGYSSKIDKEETKKIGIREFAFKPLDIREVAVLIRQVLDGAESQIPSPPPQG